MEQSAPIWASSLEARPTKHTVLSSRQNSVVDFSDNNNNNNSNISSHKVLETQIDSETHTDISREVVLESGRVARDDRSEIDIEDEIKKERIESSREGEQSPEGIEPDEGPVVEEHIKGEPVSPSQTQTHYAQVDCSRELWVRADARRGMPHQVGASHFQPEPHSNILLPKEDVEVFFSNLDKHPATGLQQSYLYPQYHLTNDPTMYQTGGISLQSPMPPTGSPGGMASQAAGYEVSPASYIHSSSNPVYVPTTRPFSGMTHPQFIQHIPTVSSPNQNASVIQGNAAHAAAAVWSPQTDGGAIVGADGHHRGYAFSASPAMTTASSPLPGRHPGSTPNGLTGYSPYSESLWPPLDGGMLGGRAGGNMPPRRPTGKTQLLSIVQDFDFDLMMTDHFNVSNSFPVFIDSKKMITTQSISDKKRRRKKARYWRLLYHNVIM